MGTVMAIDPSAQKLAVVIQTPDGYLHFRTRTMPTNIVDRCETALMWMQQLVRRYGRDVSVYIEEPVLGRGGPGSTIPQARVNGALLAGARRGGAVRVESVNNQVWKKQVVGKGSAGKPEIMSWVEDNYPQVHKHINGDQDLCDAFVICLYAARHLKIRARIEKLKRIHGGV